MVISGVHVASCSMCLGSSFISGHKSIVNSVLFHPGLLHIVTAGIERHVILHSPTKSSPCTKDLGITPTAVRALPVGSPDDHSRFLRAIFTGLGTNEVDEDMETVALFDAYVCLVLRAERGG